MLIVSSADLTRDATLEATVKNRPRASLGGVQVASTLLPLSIHCSYFVLCRHAGRHPCLGKRFAKLEVKVILAMLLARYDFELVDKHGGSVTKVPGPDRNNMYVDWLISNVKCRADTRLKN
jgi:hypothetical protein